MKFEAKTLTEAIRRHRGGVVDNPYQGGDKKVLFVCSAGILRSATGARIYANKYNTRSAGTYDFALIPLSDALLAWADEIVFVNKENWEMAVKRYPDLGDYDKVKVLNIPDIYEHMHPKMIEAFKEQYEDF